MESSINVELGAVIKVLGLGHQATLHLEPGRIRLGESNQWGNHPLKDSPLDDVLLHVGVVGAEHIRSRGDLDGHTCVLVSSTVRDGYLLEVHLEVGRDTYRASYMNNPYGLFRGEVDAPISVRRTLDAFAQACLEYGMVEAAAVRPQPAHKNATIPLPPALQ